MFMHCLQKTVLKIDWDKSYCTSMFDDLGCFEQPIENFSAVITHDISTTRP